MVFREVVMDARSPADMVGYYAETWGLPVAGDGGDDHAVRAGATTLRFRPAERGVAPSYHLAFRVPGNRFTDAKAWLGERTELVRDDGRDEFDWHFWGARAVYAHDPAGNVIELMAFPDLGPNVDGAFGGDSFVGLAELGLPVADPRETVIRLSETFGIGVWDGEDVRPDGVTPVGEQGASFVVTVVGRSWLFGGAAAEHRLEVVLGGVRAGSLEFGERPYRIVGGG